MSSFFEFQKKIEGFCDVFPPGITNAISFVVNLPIILIWIITLPPRTFLCILSSLTEIPLFGLIANIFPPITMFCSLEEGEGNSCFSECPGCNNGGKCIGVPSFYSNFCKESLKYFSILNQIFCLIGYIIVVIAIPITSLINIILALIGYQLCLDVNPNNCIPR